MEEVVYSLWFVVFSFIVFRFLGHIFLIICNLALGQIEYCSGNSPKER